jgi:hypothetical protein
MSLENSRALLQRFPVNPTRRDKIGRRERKEK